MNINDYGTSDWPALPLFSDLVNKVHNIDALEMLRLMPSNSVHCIITSPPYWGLRDYGVEGQIGLEPTLKQFIDRLVILFREARRVLRPDGTCWINMGDSYASSANGRSAADTKAAGDDDRTFRDKPFSTVGNGLKPKDLCGQPWRLAFALQDDGWWLRQDIIWAKPNPMPESITDRCTKSHEYVFMLTKSERYWFDADAIREPATNRKFAGKEAKTKKPNDTPWIDNRYAPGPSGFGHNPEGRNKRSVWTITTEPNSLAHFATFPTKLIEPMVLAGCPHGGIVYDPFMGSGTTALVARKLGRQFCGSELSPEYMTIINKQLDVPYTLNFMDLLESAG